jgi:hypothetical protein
MTFTLRFNLRKKQGHRDCSSKCVSADTPVDSVLEKILAEAPDVNPRKEPTRSSRGILAKYGPAPSAEEIDQNRAEMFANFARG